MSTSPCMHLYQNIDTTQPDAGRVLETLIRLRKQLDAEIPERNLAKTLILGTWNIREFDSSSFGERSDEAMTYIAEIVSRFDLIAIQEVRKDLKALDKLVDLLGRDRWHYIFTDITEGSPGNKERMAYLYDVRKVSFGGLAAELVLPPIRSKNAQGETVYQPVQQVARTPFVVGFRSGDTSFILASVHILYGSSRANDPDRVREIQHFARFLNDRAKDPTTWSRNIIALGDFNIFRKDDDTIAALQAEGFTVPEAFLEAGSNVNQDKIFDQIAFHTRPDRFEATGQAGVFNFFKTLYREEDESHYVQQMGDGYHHNSRGKARNANSRNRYYRTYWRTHQMSDHLPLWVELKIDFTATYLAEKLTETNRLKNKSRRLMGPAIVRVDQREHAALIERQGTLQYEDFSGSYYAGGDYQNLQLGGMDLSGKNFEEANLTGTQLAEADLAGSNFSGADFTDANLHLANLTGTNLQRATFLRTGLSKANCFEADFSNACFEQADLRQCQFEDAEVANATFIDCELTASQRAALLAGGASVA